MKVLVTGGAGFIGSHLCDAYLKRGDQVVIVDDLSSGSTHNISAALKNGAKFYQFALQSAELRNILKTEKPDLISHHAAQKSVRDSVDHPLKDADINIMGFLNLLEGARLADIKKVIVASSGGVVYGDQETFPAVESHPKRPISPYGVSKLATELYLDYYFAQWGFQSVALRYANVYGPRQDPLGEAGVVAIFCKRMLADAGTVIYGTGKQTRDFVFVGDIVEANLKAEKLFRSDGKGSFTACNVGGGRETSIIEIHQMLSKISGYSKPIVFEKEKQGEQLRSSLSSEYLKQYTGWTPQSSIEAGLKTTYDWFFRQNSKQQNR